MKDSSEKKKKEYIIPKAEVVKLTAAIIQCSGGQWETDVPLNSGN